MSKQAYRPQTDPTHAAIEDVLPTLDPISAPHIRRMGRRSGANETEIQIAKREAAEAGHAEGYREGYRAGVMAGREMGADQAYREHVQRFQAEFPGALKELDNIGEMVVEAVHRWFAETEQSLAGLSIAIAEKVIARECETDPETVVGMAREALVEVTHSTDARIRVNPFDSLVLNDHKAALLSAASSLRTIEIVDDPAIRGGCVIDTGGGVIDATVHSKLAELWEAAHRAA